MVNTRKECPKTSIEMMTMKHIKVSEDTKEVSNLVDNGTILDNNTEELAARS
jgi:hypothetical protein